MELIGIKDGTFTDSKTGEVISFLHLYVADEDDRVVGRVVDVLKIKAGKFDYIRSLGLQPGDSISPIYDKFAKVIDVSIIS